MLGPSSPLPSAHTGARRRLQLLLRCGTALCGAAAVAAGGGPASAANILPTQGTSNLATAGGGALATKIFIPGRGVTPGTVAYSSTGAAASVTLSASRTLIDWTTFEVGAGNTLTFNFAVAPTDIVVNRLTGAPVNIDAGGTVNGKLNGVPAGNIWFLSPQGVFIHGAVNAAGVLASTNVSVADLNLLSNSLSSLESQLVAGGGLVALEGIASATEVTLDASGNIVLAAPVGISGGLDLSAPGALAIEAPVTLDGAVPVNLAYSTTSPTNFTFGSSGSLTFATAGGAPATATQGGSLIINGQAYTLLYKLALPGSVGPDAGLDDIAGIDQNANGGRDAGLYAIATNLDGSGTTFGSALVAGNADLNFSGALEGLGHTTSHLSVNVPTPIGGVGLVGQSSGLIRDIGLVGDSIVATGAPAVGGLVGSNSGTVTQAYATGSVSGTGSGAGSGIGGLVGVDQTAGFISLSFVTGAVSGGAGTGLEIGGLVGGSGGGIAQSYASAAVSGGAGAQVGGLVGVSNGSVTQSYATGAVAAPSAQTIGGLAGFLGGSLTQSYATGSVSAGDAVVSSFVGGLAGLSSATITGAYASGLVSGGPSSIVGGLLGGNSGQIAQVYAFGAVTGGATGFVGGLIGQNSSTGAIAAAAFDSDTGGRLNAIGADQAGQSGNVEVLSTAGLQQTGLPIGFDPKLWGGGTNGLFPYLSYFYPSGVQAVSGFLESPGGSVPGAAINLLGAGTGVATAGTGADGYYYVPAPAGTFTSGENLLAYTASGAPLGATLSIATGATAQSGIYVIQGAVTVPTSASLLSAAPTLAQAQALALTATGADSAAQAAVNAATGLGLETTAASFTIDQPVDTANVLAVFTQGAAPITVDQPVTVEQGGGLALISQASVAVDAPINVNGMGAVYINFARTTEPGLTFGANDAVTYNAATGAAATSSQGGTLHVNGRQYTLLYSLASPGSTGPDAGLQDVAGIDSNTAAFGDFGAYALAVNLNGTGTAANPQFTSPLAGAGSNSFAGTFDGLGHTITNLTINDAGDLNVGLFGQASGVIGNVALVGGSVTANAATSTGRLFAGGLVGYDTGALMADTSSVSVLDPVGATANRVVNLGGLVGGSSGLIALSYATGDVINGGAASQPSFLGGLVGYTTGGSITQSYATGAVTGGLGNLAGGLAGYSNSAVSEAYAAGKVAAPGGLAGGLIAYNDRGGTALATAFDATTTGLGIGIAFNNNVSSGIPASLTTNQLQTGGLPAGFNASAWGGGSAGDFPYLTAYYPAGVQVFTGAADVAPNTGPFDVGLQANAAFAGAASVGADNSYYIAVPAGSVTSGQSLLAYAASPGTTGATLGSATGAAVQTGLNLYPGAVTIPTAATSLSTAPTQLQAQILALGAAGTNVAAQNAIDAASGLGLLASGPGFSVDQPVNTSSVFLVQTGADAPLSVDAAIAIGPGGHLALLSGSALAIFAPIIVDGAGRVSLTYNTNALINLSFGDGGSLTFATGAGGVASSSQGGALNINGQNYTLLYNLASPGSTGPDQGLDDIAGIDNNTAAGGDAGFYALATDLLGTGGAASPQFTSSLAGAGASPFSGIFEGLGHTVTDLTISNPTSGLSPGSQAVGLFGNSQGMVRDIRLVGAAIAGANDASVGAVVGANQGSLFAANAAGSVSAGANSNIGVLVGYNNGTVSGSFASGTASGAGDNSAIGGLVGLQAVEAEMDSSTAFSAVSGGGANSDIGGLVGNTAGTIHSSYAGGAVAETGLNADVGGFAGHNSGFIDGSLAAGGVTDSQGGAVGGFVGANDAGGTINTSSAAGPVTAVANSSVGGFAGLNNGAINQSIFGGLVIDAGSAHVGGMVGDNDATGTITGSWAAGTVVGGASSAVGGLAGYNNGSISQSFSASVTTDAQSGSALGGLVGVNDTGGTITFTYATGPVIAGAGSGAGGLVGHNLGAINQGFATGAVSGALYAGGLVGHNDTAGLVATSAYDLLTTGQTAAIGVDSNANPQSGNIAGLTTTQLQTGGLPAGFDTEVWGGGFGGLYPYLMSFFPSGVQAVSGFVYSDAGVTPLASGAGGAVDISVTANGVGVGATSTGANGYYYIATSAGVLSAGETLLASTVSGAPLESNSYIATGAAAQAQVDIFGSAQLTGVLPTQGTINLGVAGSGELATNILLAGAEAPGMTPYSSSGTSANVTLTASRTLIDWTTFHIGSGDTLNFNFSGSANDIVINRVTGGTISVDAGGVVNGFYNEVAGGNIWFLAGNGVFLHGSVSAAGVLASNTVTLADLNLLGDDPEALFGELAARGGTIGLNSPDGVASVSDASVDAAGNIVLNGDANAGADGTVQLSATGGILQTGGVILANTLISASQTATTLNGPNQVASLGGATTVGGTFAFTNGSDAGLRVASEVVAGGGDIDITTTGGGGLTLAATLRTDTLHAVNLVSDGPILQVAGGIITGTFSGASTGGANFGISANNSFGVLAGFTNTGVGDVVLTDTNQRGAGLTVSGMVDVGAGNDLLLSVNDGGPLVLAANLRATGGFISLSSTGSLSQTQGQIEADTLSGNATGGVSLGAANLVNTLYNVSNAGSGDLTFADSIDLAASAISNPVGSVTLSSAGALSGAVYGISSGQDLTLSAGTSLSLGVSPIVARDYTVTAASFGGLSLSPIFSPGRDFKVNATGDLVLATSLAAPRNLTVSAAGSLDASKVQLSAAGGALLVRSGAALTVGSTTANSGPTSLIASGGDVTLVGFINAAGQSLTLNSAGATFQTGGSIAATAFGGSSVGGASLTQANAIQSVTGFTNFDSGAFSLTNAQSLAIAGAVDNTQVVTTTGVGRDIAIDVTSGDLTGAGVFTASGDVALRADAGGLAFESASAGNNIVLRASGALSVSGVLEAGAGGGVAGAPSGAGATLAAASPLSLFGGASPTLTGADVDISASSVAIAAAVEADGPGANVRIVATGADTRQPAISLANYVRAAGDIALDDANGSAGSIVVTGSLIAGRDVAVRSAAGSITLTSVTAGDDAVLSAPAGALSLNGSITARGATTQGVAQTLFATLSGTLNGLYTLNAQSIFLSARTYANAGYGTSTVGLTAGQAIGVSLGDPSGLALADASPSSGSWVRSSTLMAPHVSLFETGGPIDVGTATVNGPVASFDLYTGGQVNVTGIFAPATDNTVALTIGSATAANWTPANLEVVNDGGTAPDQGAVGFVPGANAATLGLAPKTFFSAALYARGDLLLGSTAFISTNQTSPTPSPGGAMTVTLAAGDVSLSAGQLILQQNSGAPPAKNAVVQGVGSYVTRTLNLSGFGDATPSTIDLYGVFASASGLLTAGAPANSGRISLSANLASSGHRVAYQFNGCQIDVVSACGGVAPLLRGLPLDPVDQGVALAFGDLTLPGPPRFPDDAFASGDGENPGVFITAGDGQPGGPPTVVGDASFTDDPFAALGQRASHPAIVLGWQIRNGLLRFDEPDIEDRLITGAASEEIWRTPEVRP